MTGVNRRKGEAKTSQPGNISREVSSVVNISVIAGEIAANNKRESAPSTDEFWHYVRQCRELAAKPANKAHRECMLAMADKWMS